MIRRLLIVAGLGLALLGSGCQQSGETGLTGTLKFGDRPLAGAEVEVYLKGEKDRSTRPFAVGGTDQEGRFRILLPAGRYFLIGKKRDDRGGRTRILMAECPTNPVEVDGGIRELAPFTLREMGRDGTLVPDPGTAVSGRVVHHGEPVARAFVYVYTEDASGLMGPSYGEAVQAAEDGTFRIELPAGRYFLAARRRADGSRLGEPAPGDLNGSYPHNPVAVEKGQERDLGTFSLAAVDAEVQRQRRQAGKFAATPTGLTGRAVDKDGRPLADIYVFAYLDSRMVGKPTYISDPTGSDGRFRLNLGAADTYFIGARSAFGGPLEPGEWVGTFDGRADHGVRVEAGRKRDLGDLTLREVW